MPNLDEEERTRLIPIEGTPVDLLDPPKGCGFGPRCEHCMKVCLENKPPMVDLGDGHVSACWLHVKEMREQAAKEGKE
jgi:oligopeptide transport system ATP-binding protein